VDIRSPWILDFGDRAETLVCDIVKPFAFGFITSVTCVQNLVDLAGSEKAKQAGTSGQRLTEGGFINKSLFTLSNVIQQLSSSAPSVSVSCLSDFVCLRVVFCVCCAAVRPSVRGPSSNTYLTWCDICVISGGILIKLATNISYVGRHFWKSFLGHRSKVKVMTGLSACTCLLFWFSVY